MFPIGRHKQEVPKYRNKGVDDLSIQSGSNFLAFVRIFLLEDILSDLSLKDTCKMTVTIFLLEDSLSDLNLKDSGKMAVTMGGPVCGFFSWKIFYLICI